MVKSSAAGPARTAPPDPATTNQACAPGGAGPQPRDAERATPRSSPRRLARATPATQTPEPSPGTTSESPRPDHALNQQTTSSQTVRRGFGAGQGADEFPPLPEPGLQ